MGTSDPPRAESAAPEPPLAVRDAYRLWAPTYERETGMTRLDEIAVERLSPRAGLRLLDAGCGTGRRLPPGRSAVGVDLVFEMLAAGSRPPGLLNADLLHLPFASGAFDLVWCRLAIGHVKELRGAYRELARVAAPRATLVVTDVHPDSVRSGHTRDFDAPDGRRRSVAHHLHEEAEHAAAAAAAGLAVEETLSLAIGPEIRSFYEAAGALGRYERQVGERVLFALRLSKPSFGPR